MLLFAFVIQVFLPGSTLSALPSAANSEIAFEAESRLTNVRGVFRRWTSETAGGTKRIRIEVCSLDTANASRDNHLRSADFFDCAAHPDSVFTLGGISGGKLTGTLRLKGREHPLECIAQETPARLSGVCVFDRRLFGIEYQSSLNPISYNVKAVFSLDLTSK